MNKLIKLLNEYEREIQGLPKDFEDYTIWDIEGNKIVQSSCDPDEREYFKYYIISKDYQFIKWLVEKDNIDFDKCGLDIKKYLSYNKRYDKGIVMAENYDNDTFEVREFYSPYEQLLMLLAIQDEPIEFLISILR